MATACWSSAGARQPRGRRCLMHTSMLTYAPCLFPRPLPALPRSYFVATWCQRRRRIHTPPHLPWATSFCSCCPYVDFPSSHLEYRSTPGASRLPLSPCPFLPRRADAEAEPNGVLHAVHENPLPGYTSPQIPTLEPLSLPQLSPQPSPIELRQSLAENQRFPVPPATIDAEIHLNDKLHLPAIRVVVRLRSRFPHTSLLLTSPSNRSHDRRPRWN